jgi:hypothetical protein
VDLSSDRLLMNGCISYIVLSKSAKPPEGSLCIKIQITSARILNINACLRLTYDMTYVFFFLPNVLISATCSFSILKTSGI